MDVVHPLIDVGLGLFGGRRDRHLDPTGKTHHPWFTERFDGLRDRRLEARSLSRLDGFFFFLGDYNHSRFARAIRVQLNFSFHRSLRRTLHIRFLTHGDGTAEQTCRNPP